MCCSSLLQTRTAQGWLQLPTGTNQDGAANMMCVRTRNSVIVVPSLEDEQASTITELPIKVCSSELALPLIKIGKL